MDLELRKKLVKCYIWSIFIQTVKYAGELVLLAKEENVLQDMIDKLIETGRCYGMEMNVKKTKVMRISLVYATHNTHKPIPSLPR